MDPLRRAHPFLRAIPLGAFALCVFFLMVPTSEVVAQTTPVPRDSLRAYDLAEIVVRADGEPARSTTTLQKVRLADIARMDASSVSGVMRLIPAAHVQTNSRGESLVYLRGAGERQVALFFDGALLNVPWDNRVDLSLIPAGVVGGMTVAKGVPSVLYGANVLGGAINLTSRELAGRGAVTEFGGRVGFPAQKDFVATHVRRGRRLAFTGAVGVADRSGDALSAEAELPFSQRSDALRTNSDRRLFNVFGQGSYRFGEATRLGVAVLHADGKKGVAPESHVDPAVASVRFWRYPQWRNTMVIANGEAALGARSRLRGAAWVTSFAQAIDSYASDTYRLREGRQDDDDLTFGTRLILGRDVGAGRLSASANVLTSRHEMREAAYDTVGAVVDRTPVLSFQQHIYSFGAEYALTLDRLEVLAGASLDGVAMPRTGDKPHRDPFVDYGVTTGVSYALSPTWRLRAAAGRKARFPTMRELFGEALRRFQVNPDLKPETALLAEGGVEVRRPRASAQAVVFVNRTYDTIDQERLPDGRRRRINLDGGRVVGVELSGMAAPRPRWSIDGHVTYNDPSGYNDDGSTRPIPERPKWLGTVASTYNTRNGLSFTAQALYTGRAYSLDEGNTFVALPTSFVFNVRLALRRTFPSTSPILGEFFIHVNNATDALVVPQLGLPAPGREVSAGINIGF